MNFYLSRWESLVNAYALPVSYTWDMVKNTEKCAVNILMVNCIFFLGKAGKQIKCKVDVLNCETEV
jgi:hypothetical protein